MTAQDALLKIKALFAEDVPAPEAAVEPTAKEYPLLDGTIVLIDSLEVGGKVAVVTPDGPVPAPAGDHTLADGQVITVDETGTITAIATPEAATAAPAEDMSAKLADLQSKLTQLQLEYESRFAAQEHNFISALEDQKTKVLGLKEIIESMMVTPSAEPIQKQKHFESKDERIAKFLEFTKKIK